MGYFYATDTPHDWSSGPVLSTYNINTHRPIASLEEARELALAARRGRPGYEGYVQTSYGTIYDSDVEPGARELPTGDKEFE